MTLTAQGKVTLHTSTYPLDAINDAMADLDNGRPPGPRDPRPGRSSVGAGDGQAPALQPRGPPAAAGRRRRAGQHRQGHARPEGPQRGARAADRRAHDHQRRRPDRARDRAVATSSRTWARSSCARSPTRRATSPATGRRPPRCSPRPSCAKACARSTRASTRCCCGAGSRRPPPRSSTELSRTARPVEGRDQLRHIATIAAKEDEVIGNAVADALDRVGAEGVVTIEESDVPGIEVDFVEGMHVENGWISPYMAADRTRMETVFEDPYILMTNKPISHAQDLLPALDAVMKAPRPLVVLAEKVDGSALGMLVSNNQHRTLQAVAVRAPGFGHRRIDHLGDLAAFTGGQVIAEEAGLTLDHVKPESFGRARRVIVTARLDDVHRGRGRARAPSRRGCADPHRARARDAGPRRRGPPGAPRAPRAAARRHPRRRADRRRAQRGACGAPRARSRRRRRRSPKASSPAAAPRCCAPSPCSTRSARGRLRPRRRRRAQRSSPSRCTGSPRTPATTGRRPSTRSARCPMATASTRSRASSATSSRRA